MPRHFGLDLLKDKLAIHQGRSCLAKLPFDWYNARFSVNFKVNKLADGANIAVDDHNGIVNRSRSFIQKLYVKMNGREVYDCNNAIHVVNIKNLLEYSPTYAQSTATNEFYYLDTNRHARRRTTCSRKLQQGICRTESATWCNRYGEYRDIIEQVLIL